MDDALAAFFLPAFKVARRYDRAVGYFSSSALECFAEPFGRFVQFGGTVRLVTSIELRDVDVAVIDASRSAEAVCEERILEIIDREFGVGAVSTGVRKLGALLEAGRLEIQIATPAHGRGIYHEKVGVFYGEGDDYVAFSGSTNESREALVHNYECIDVYPSWEAPSSARSKKEHFEALWAGVAPGARTYSFPEAARRKLIRAIKEAPPRRAAGAGDDEGLWPHQERAVAEFMDKRRGILEMATGTGKINALRNGQGGKDWCLLELSGPAAVRRNRRNVVLGAARFGQINMRKSLPPRGRGSMAGRRSPQTPSIGRSTWPPEPIPSCYRRSRHAKFQHQPRRHPFAVCGAEMES